MGATKIYHPPFDGIYHAPKSKQLLFFFKGSFDVCETDQRIRPAPQIRIRPWFCYQFAELVAIDPFQGKHVCHRTRLFAGKRVGG